MPSNDDLDVLVDIAKMIGGRPEWHDFARYCDLRGRGNRGKAFEALDLFLQQTRVWTFEKRLEFARWVMTPRISWDNALIPQPIRDQLVIPTFRKWHADDPQNAEAHLWLGILRCDDPRYHLAMALKIDPACEIARFTLIDWLLSDIEYNQHELPSFYIYDPRTDLKRLDEIQILSDASGVAERRKIFDQEISELRTQAETWLAAHPREGDFAAY